MKAIYKMSCNCGRMGNLSGVFVADSEYIAFLIREKITVYFGEVLGKHSDIYGEIEESEIAKISEDPNYVKMFEELKLSCGYNPLEYPVSSDIGEKYGVKDCETAGELLCEIFKKERQQ